MSTFHERLLLLKNVTVNRNLGFDDVCKEKHAKIIFYENRNKKTKKINRFIRISERLPDNHYYGDIKKYKLNPTVKPISNVAEYWEIEDMFLKVNNIKPEWIWINTINKDEKGLLNETTGQWSGAVGMIQRDEADYAVKNYIPSYEMIKVADLSPTLYAPLHWVTCRREVSPIWNLLGLFTKVLLSLKCFNVKNESKTKMIHAGCFPNANTILTVDKGEQF